jgi:hypothetical protein
MPMTSADFLEIALLRAPTPDEIGELLTSHVNEDRWLEYKRGEWLTDTDKKRQQKLRQYIAAFANADGGAILVGVAGAEKPEKPTDKQWAVDGCPKEQSQPWDEWASNSLSPLSGYLGSTRFSMPRARCSLLQSGDPTVWCPASKMAGPSTS